MREQGNLEERRISTGNVNVKDGFLEFFENYMDDFMTSTPEDKGERVKALLSAIGDFKKLDEKTQKELLLTNDEEFQMPIIVTALVKHDMVDELRDILKVLPEDYQDKVLDSADEDETTLLHMAMKSDSVKVVKDFLKNGFIHDAQLSDDGDTPLSVGIDNGSFNAVDEFLDYLAKHDKKGKRDAINKCDEHNNSALHIVATSSKLDDFEKKEMTEVLFKHIRHERVFNVVNSDGYTAEEEAVMSDNADLAADIVSKKTKVLFERLEGAILYAPNINKEIYKDNSKAVEESKSSDENTPDRRPVNEDVNKILRQGKKLQKHLQNNPEQVDKLDEMLLDDTVGQSKPGAGQRLRMKLDEYVQKLDIDDNKFEQLVPLLTKGANKNLNQSSVAASLESPAVVGKRPAVALSQAFTSSGSLSKRVALAMNISSSQSNDWELINALMDTPTTELPVETETPTSNISSLSVQETLTSASARLSQERREARGSRGAEESLSASNNESRTSAIDPESFKGRNGSRNFG